MRKIMLIIGVLIIIITVSVVGFFFRPEGNGGIIYIKSVDIGIDQTKSSGIGLIDELGLNETVASRFNNSTITLSITETTLNVTNNYHYQISNLVAVLWGAEASRWLVIEYPTINYRYHISFHYLINSTDPEVRNVTIIGSNNYLNFSFIIKSDRTINITMDPEFSSFSSMIGYEFGNGQIWVVDSPNRKGIPGHVFIIIPRMVSTSGPP
jgi:hypothetical protein